MRVLYTFFIFLYECSIHVSALFSHKAKLWVAGRKDLKQSLAGKIPAHKSVLWFHCASLGEFEQGRPVIEALREQYPDHFFLLTFFSPSGYEVRKKYGGADLVCYLPADTPSNVRWFTGLVKPRAVFIIKYEYWYNLLNELKRRNIPVFLVSAIFRGGQHFFRPWGGWFRKHLGDIGHFFVQDDSSAMLLKCIGLFQVTVTGDTRFDRVAAISSQPAAFPPVAAFCGDSPVFLAGSTWPADEEIISLLLHQGPTALKFIIAPHEVHESHIQQLAGTMAMPVLRYTQLPESMENAASRILVIDTIGILNQLYRYATVTYIGGGFGKGIHNILEAAAFGKPVFFGPNYGKFREAHELLERGGAVCIRHAAGLVSQVTELLSDGNRLRKMSDTCRDYVQENAGATQKILKHVSPLIK